MTAGLYDVAVYPDSLATSLAGVQNVRLRVGRTSWSTAPEASHLTVYARYPNGYTTPNEGLVINGQITLSQGISGGVVWDGVISSIEVEYGKPWNGTTGQGDSVVITAQGYLGELAQYTASIQAAPGTRSLLNMTDRLATQGINIDAPERFAPVSLQANPITQNVAEWARALSYTFPLFLDEDNAYLRAQLYYGVGPTLSETTSDATSQRYESVRFTALQLDYASQVTVTGQNTSFSGTVNDGSGGPYNEANVTSLSSSNAQALAMANYLWETYSLQEQRIAQVVALEEQQDPDELHIHEVRQGTYLRVKFRGDDYDAVVIGYELDARPGSARWTYHLVPLDFAAWFTLDDDNSANDAPSLGALDIGRLGF
jgi:hypothetical protein